MGAKASKDFFSETTKGMQWEKSVDTAGYRISIAFSEMF